MRTDDLLALEQSAESPLGRRWDRVPRRYQRGSIRPLGLMWRVDIDINKSGTAEGSFRLLGETGAFSFTRSCHIQIKEEPTL